MQAFILWIQARGRLSAERAKNSGTTSFSSTL